MLIKSPKSVFYLWCFVALHAVFAECQSNSANLPFDTDSDVENLAKGDIHYNRLVWDPTGHTITVFNISGTSPLHIVLIRKNVGNCEMFFLRLKGVTKPLSFMTCVAELSDTSLETKCEWVNHTRTLEMNEGNIYGMPNDCGPWYLTIYLPNTFNTTALSVEVSSPYDPLVFRWFRVITNLALLPAVILALKRRFYAQAIIYVLTTALSLMYHLCEAELHCFKQYSRLHYSDYYVSDFSIIATIWTMTRMKPPMIHLVFLTIAMLLQFAVTETFNSNYHFYINLILSGPALLYVCFQYISRTVKYGRIYPSPKRWIFNLLPGYSLAMTGAIVNLVISEPENYYYVHCIWHVTIMLSVAFLLPVPIEEDQDERWWMDKLGEDSYSPLK